MFDIYSGCDTFNNAIMTYQSARSSLGEILSAFEYMDSSSMQVVQENLGLTNPLSTHYGHYLLVETSGSDSVHDDEKFTRFLENAIAKKMVTNGTLATDTKQIQVSEF